MEALSYILLIPFLYFNYKIVASDIKTKKIPNKYLGFLLLLIPFWWTILFSGVAPSYLPGISEINPLTFSVQIIATFIVSFVLYYFGIWAAGDAKYLLVLSLFIPYIGIVPFIGNIALVTIAYLLGYFVWFWFGKTLFNSEYRKSLFRNIRHDLEGQWEVYKKNKGGDTYKIIAKFLLVFLILFVSIRLARIYLFNSIIENSNKIELFSEIIEKYNVYLVFGLIGFFLGGMYLFRVLINKTKVFFANKLGKKIETIGNILLALLTASLLIFISYELVYNYDEIIDLLIKIFTVYVAIYILVKILLYSYHITFGIGEVYYKDVSKIIPSDNIDIKWMQNNIGKYLNINYIKSKKIFLPPKLENEIIHSNFSEIIFNINVQKNKKEILRKNILLTQKVLRLYKKDESDINISNNIKINKTFSYGPYIFAALILSLSFPYI